MNIHPTFIDKTLSFRFFCQPRLVFLIFFLSVSIFPSKGQNPQDTLSQPARLEWDIREYDFGDIPANSPKRHYDFYFTNTGGRPLVIKQVSSSCGCTKYHASTRAIQPGKRGKVRVIYDGSSQPLKKFRKSVTVYSNDPRRYSRIFIKGRKVAAKKKSR